MEKVLPHEACPFCCTSLASCSGWWLWWSASWIPKHTQGMWSKKMVSIFSFYSNQTKQIKYSRDIVYDRLHASNSKKASDFQIGMTKHLKDTIFAWFSLFNFFGLNSKKFSYVISFYEVAKWFFFFFYHVMCPWHRQSTALISSRRISHPGLLLALFSRSRIEIPSNSFTNCLCSLSSISCRCSQFFRVAVIWRLTGD